MLGRVLNNLTEKYIYQMNLLGQDPSDKSAWTNVGEIRVIQEKALREMVDLNMGGGEAARANTIDGVTGD